MKLRLHAQLRRRQYEEEKRRQTAERLVRETEAARMRAVEELAEVRQALLSDLEKKNRELEEAWTKADRESRLKSEILAVVSHDLKNPLTAINLKASLLLAKSDDKLVRTHADSIAKNAERIRTLIDSILDAATIEAGALKLDTAAVSIASLFQEILDMFLPIAADKRVSLEQEIDEAIPDLRLDRGRMLQLFGNLVGNALKFTPANGRVRLVARSLEQEVELRVEDTGAGIPDAFLPYVFERFKKGGDAKAQGAGLGLFIAKGIVEAHGGSIGVEPREGEGTCFVVRLPVSAAPSAA